MHDNREKIDKACAGLRTILEQTMGMTRRDFARALISTSAGTALIPAFAARSAGGLRAAELPVTAFVFGGVWRRAAATAFGDPFTAKTGIPVQYQEPYTFARVRAMHEAKAQQIDVFSADGSEVVLAGRANMLAPMDWSIVDRSHLSEEQLRVPNVVGGYSLAMVLCYNKKKWPGEHHPKSWADFWDVEKFPGRRAVRRTPPNWTVDAALKSDGVSEKDFYPLDVDRAFRSLDRIKPHVKVWWSDNSQAQQLMEQEEVDLITMMNGRATESIGHGAPFEIVWNEAINDESQGWAVPVGSPNPKGGMKFVDFVTRPEPQAAFARLLYYAPRTPGALDLLEPDVARQLPTYPANREVAHIMNPEWWADNLAPVQQRMERWLQS